MIFSFDIIAVIPGFLNSGHAWGVVGVAVTTVWALIRSGSRGDLISRLNMLRSGKPPVGKVDLSEGPLWMFAREFESQLSRVIKKPTYFNLVDLCGATRTCEHESTSEWYLNRVPDLKAFAKLKELTERSKEVLEAAISSRIWNYHEKEQIKGMILNISARIEVYDVLLSTQLSLDEQSEKLDHLSSKMEIEQMELAQSTSGNQR